MCDGGRPDDHYASFSLEELSAAVEEIHRVGKRAVGHCEGAEAIARAVEAGLDEIEHINFLHPDGTRRWNQETADEILRRGVYVCPTIQTGWRKIERLKAIEEEQGLSPDQQERLDHLLYKTTTKADFIGRFHDMGVPIVAGTDAIARFGDYAIGLRLLHAAGLSKMETVLAATSLAAEAIGMGGEVGSVEPGKYADLVYIDGDPLSNLRALSQVETVVLGGEIVVEGHGTGEDDGGGIDYVERVLGDIKAH
jgi:imidazolonepropionase-like amidohydrolase